MKRMLAGLLFLLFLGWGESAQAQCFSVPSNITVSGFGCYGPNGTYTPSGTYNGAPKWISAYGPGTYRIVWEYPGRWEIQSAFGFPPYPIAANSTGSITNLPCSGNWTDPEDVGCISTFVSLSGGCGSLATTVVPAVSISADPGNIIATGTSVTFTAVPVNGGSTPNYIWEKNGMEVGSNSATYTDSGLNNGDVITCTLISGASCASPISVTSSGITMQVSCYPDIVVTGDEYDFTGTYTYLDQYDGAPRWVANGINSIYWDASASGWIIWSEGDPIFGGGYGYFNGAGSINELPCSGWTGLTFSGCGPLPAGSVTITANPGTSIAPGTSVTFTANPVNGGTTPVYQWKKNGNNVGSGGNVYTDNTLSNGDVIAVTMTSSAACVQPVTSAPVTITFSDPCANVGERIYVKPGGVGNGSSWAQATGDLQAAIDNTCGATEVWVASGTYKPTHYPTGCVGCSETRDYGFMLKNGIKVYGGFAGTESSLSERVSGNESVLSGDIDNNGINDIGNVRHVVISVNDDATTLLDGFVITKGYAENTNADAQTETPLLIETKEVYRSYSGGILFFYSAMKLHNVTISDNYGYYGGGAYLAGCSNLTFNNCQFLNNKTTVGYGNAICDFNSVGTQIDSCLISNNTGVPVISGKGAYYCTGAGSSVKHTRFISNSAAEGGAIYVNNNDLVIDNCTFDGNAAIIGGAISYHYNGTISNSLLVRNSASGGDSFGSGGAIYLNNADLTATNCTVANNFTTNSKGGGISSYFGDLLIRNSILWGNTEAVAGALTSQISTAVQSSSLIMSHCIIQEGIPSFVTDAGYNKIANPLFIDPATGNFRVSACSPAINAGNNAIASGTDLIGGTRIQQGTVDLGAYETMPGIGFISSIALSNSSAPECHNTSCTEDDDFTADITVTFTEIPQGGVLQLSGASLYAPGDVQPVPVENITGTSYTFTGVALHADGAYLALSASFTEGCSSTYESLTKAPACTGSNDIIVSGFNNAGDNGTYIPSGTYNNSPRWSNGVCEIIYGSGIWFFKRLGSAPFTMGTNFSGIPTQVPCAGWYGISDGTPVVTGACDGQSGPLPCAISNIGLINISSCNGNNTAFGTDDFFTADVVVTFEFAPAGKTLVLKKGNTTIASTQSDLFCATTFTFEDIALPADGQAVALTAEFIDLGGGTTCSFTSGTLTTAPAACSASSITGKVIWEHLHFIANPIPVPDVTITMTGESSDTDLTTALGTYELSGSGDVFVTAAKNDNPRQGIDAADVTRIRQHALGTLLLNDGYKVLAADVNENNSVTSADATIVQQALLGTTSAGSLLDNPSWRFVVAGAEFSNPNAPWAFPTIHQIIDVNAPVTDIDFIGVKMGDVNGSWNLSPVPAEPTATWLVANRPLETGTVVRVPFALSQTRSDVAAWQFMLRLDPAFVTINRVIPQNALPLTPGDFGVSNMEEGELRSVFAVAEGLPIKAGATAFELELKVVQGGIHLSDVLSIDKSDILPARIYDTRLSAGQMNLAFTTAREYAGPTAVGAGKHNTFELYQNIPNPMTDETIIGFALPIGSEAVLTIHDATGKLVTQVKGDYFAGFNTITLPRHLLGRTTGVLSYTLTAGEYSATRRLVILD